MYGQLRIGALLVRKLDLGARSAQDAGANYFKQSIPRLTLLKRFSTNGHTTLTNIRSHLDSHPCYRGLARNGSPEVLEGLIDQSRANSLSGRFYKFRGLSDVTRDINNPSSPADTHNPGSKGQSKTNEEPKAVAYWYLISCALVFATVAVGGLTRLTESGLSIVEWNVIKGMKAPSSNEEWEQEFEKYKLYPEYQKLKHNMDLSEFKKIFYMEWLHRNLGRIVGMVFVIPAFYFGYRGRLSRKLKITTFTVGTLIGFQGFLGWLMVKTGLREELRAAGEIPRVDAGWLCAHLGSALMIYSILLYTAMGMLQKKAIAPPSLSLSNTLTRFRKVAILATTLVFITALSGALVAGLDAGLIYSEFPYMGGHIIPKDMWGLTTDPPVGKKPETWWVNLYKNPTTVQFNHRLLGTTTALCTMALFLYARTLPLPRQVVNAAGLLPLIALIQASLGVTTLLYHVPICAASVHQSGSVVLLSFSLWLLNCIKKFR